MKKKKNKANVNHIAHQVGVTGVGAHKNKKKTIPRKRKQSKEESHVHFGTL